MFRQLVELTILIAKIADRESERKFLVEAYDIKKEYSIEESKEIPDDLILHRLRSRLHLLLSTLGSEFERQCKSDRKGSID